MASNKLSKLVFPPAAGKIFPKLFPASPSLRVLTRDLIAQQPNYNVIIFLALFPNRPRKIKR